MSGGHWNYEEHNHRDQAEMFAGWLRLLPEVEHELDWGICGDTCLTCAYMNVGRAVEYVLDGNPAMAREFLAKGPAICPRCAKIPAYNTPEQKQAREAWWGNWIAEQMGWEL